MDPSMKAIIVKGKRREREPMYGQMDQHTVENGRPTKLKE